MCSVAIAVSPHISRVSSAAATTQLTDTGAALVAGAGDISAPAILRHKTSLITGTVIAKNYVLRITAVIIVSGESIEVPSCGAAKICVPGPRPRWGRWRPPLLRLAWLLGMWRIPSLMDWLPNVAGAVGKLGNHNFSSI